MTFGSQAIDGGIYMFTTAERDSFIKLEPLSKKHFKNWVGGKELLHQSTSKRFVLYLKDVPLTELKKCHMLLKKSNKLKHLDLG